MILDDWRWLLSHAGDALRAAAADMDPGRPADVQRLRRMASPQRVAAALQLLQARERAGAKFPGLAEHLVADVAGLEQASSLAVARVKAARFAQLRPGEEVLDLCCGIGGDAIALDQAGLHVLALDRDPVRAWMAGHNAGCPAAAMDVTTIPAHGRLYHVDPARRSERGRSWRLADMQPGPDWLADWTRRNPDGAIKLSPAVNLAELALPGEVQFISEVGRLVQAVVWTGQLQRSPRTATRVEDGQVHELQGEPDDPPTTAMRRLVMTVDPAVERARLLHLLGLPTVHPQLGLLTADEPVESPWLTTFEVLDHLPYQARKVKRHLAQLGAGVVEVKTRGKAVDPDVEQRRLRGRGDRPLTVFVLRWDRRVMATIARRA